jgi:molybdate transport system substrate-binding protein
MRLFLALLSLLVSGCISKPENPLTIAVSGNMQFAMHEMVTSFEKSTGVKCNMVVSSSGKLTAQIMKGAPFDILVSADMKYPMELFKVGKAVDPPAVYAFGKLVLWSIREDITPSVKNLGLENIRHIAIANPATAPYGAAAIEVLENYGLLDSLQQKLVYGESISQTNQFIISGHAEAGFTAMSVVKSKQMRNRGQWIEIPHDLYSPVSQGAVIIDNENTALARQFYDFLFSPEGQMMLQHFGYGTVSK